METDHVGRRRRTRRLYDFADLFVIWERHFGLLELGTSIGMDTPSMAVMGYMDSWGAYWDKAKTPLWRYLGPVVFGFWRDSPRISCRGDRL